jgi:hypothetical protein
MALFARCHKKRGIDGGAGIRRFQHCMGRMTIGATGDLFRITEPIVFPVITLHISRGSHIEDTVSLHHLLVTVASQADFGMEYPVGMELWVIHGLDIMKIMAIMTGGGILIACRHRFAVNGLPVNGLVVMALDALGDDNAFILFPVTVRVYIGVAIGALYILLDMHTGIMLGIFLFVAAFTPDLLHFDFTFHVSGKVGKLDMAAVTAIFTVNGSDKRSGGDLVAVAAEAGGRINGHTLLSPQGISRQQDKQDHGRNAEKHFQHADPPAKQKFKETRHCKTCCVRSSSCAVNLI